MKLTDCSAETQDWVLRECIAPIVSSAMEKISLEDIIADCKIAPPLFQRIYPDDMTYHMLSCWAESPNVHFSAIVSRVTRVLRLDVNPVWFNLKKAVEMSESVFHPCKHWVICESGHSPIG